MGHFRQFLQEHNVDGALLFIQEAESMRTVDPKRQKAKIRAIVDKFFRRQDSGTAFINWYCGAISIQFNVKGIVHPTNEPPVIIYSPSHHLTGKVFGLEIQTDSTDKVHCMEKRKKITHAWNDTRVIKWCCSLNKGFACSKKERSSTMVHCLPLQWSTCSAALTSSAVCRGWTRFLQRSSSPFSIWLPSHWRPHGIVI